MLIRLDPQDRKNGKATKHCKLREVCEKAYGSTTAAGPLGLWPDKVAMPTPEAGIGLRFNYLGRRVACTVMFEAKVNGHVVVAADGTAFFCRSKQKNSQASKTVASPKQNSNTVLLKDGPGLRPAAACVPHVAFCMDKQLASNGSLWHLAFWLLALAPAACSSCMLLPLAF